MKVLKQNALAGQDLPVHKLLALDQATKTTGWSIWQDNTLVEFGHITFDDEDPFIRNNKLTHWMGNMIETRDIDEVVIEDIQMQVNNVVVFQRLAQLQGAIIDMLIDWHIDYKIIRPVEWRAICNLLKGQDKHRATQKKIAQEWVYKTFDCKCTQDEADAICIGYAAIQQEDNEMNWED